MVAPKAFVRRRFRPSHAKQRLTTHRRGCASNPTCPGILRTISMAMEVASRTRSAEMRRSPSPVQSDKVQVDQIVSKFTHPMRLEGFGDGINVLAGPNECGKSTLLSALRAVLFERHWSGQSW